MVDLGTLGGSDSSAYAVNAAGQVVGQATAIPWPRNHGHNIYHAFLYDGIPGKGGRMYDLGMLPGGESSTARDINASGEIVGMSEVSGHKKHAFLYKGIPGKGGKMIALPGGWSCEAYSINDAGYICGNSDVGGIIWKPDGTIIDLRKWLVEVNPKAAKHWGLLRPGKITNSGVISGNGLYRDEPSGNPVFHRFYLDASGLISSAKGQGMP
jgi:probable HAF family extracellular repeat protein